MWGAGKQGQRVPLEAIPHDAAMSESLTRAASEPVRLRRYVQRACGEMMGLRATLPENQPCSRIEQDLRLAEWRLKEYWSRSEAGTWRDATTDHQAREYRARLESTVKWAVRLANERDESNGKSIFEAIARRICTLYNAPIPTTPEEMNLTRITVEQQGRGDGA